ncbi:MAG: PorV/PorQ family protein [Sphingomonadales bacterium]|nr:PorV/PorQ family protein [Sphingomonadales bacterium]MBM3923946.1 PorV/PorQ family protein [Sphingomonadales bacterium]
MRIVLLYLWSKASFMRWSPGWGQRWGFGLAVAMLMALVMALTGVAEAQWLPAFGRSRIGTAGFQFLKIQPDARSAAMAGNAINLVNEPGVMFWNPAGLVHGSDRPWAGQVNHLSYWSGIRMQSAALARRMGSGDVMAFGLRHLQTGAMPVTTEFQPMGTGQTFNATNTSMGMAYARPLTDRFALGLSLNWIYEQMPDWRVHNATVDMGFRYDIGWREMRLAVGINHFGMNVTPQGRLLRPSLSRTDTLGTFESLAPPTVLRLGLSGLVYREGEHKIDGVVQLNHPTDQAESLGAAMEYSYRDLMFVRGGYEHQPGVGQWPSWGLGWSLPRSFGNLRLDYAFAGRQGLGPVHRLGVMVAWGSVND